MTPCIRYWRHAQLSVAQHRLVKQDALLYLYTPIGSWLVLLRTGHKLYFEN